MSLKTIYYWDGRTTASIIMIHEHRVPILPRTIYLLTSALIAQVIFLLLHGETNQQAQTNWVTETADHPTYTLETARSGLLPIHNHTNNTVNQHVPYKSCVESPVCWAVCPSAPTTALWPSDQSRRAQCTSTWRHSAARCRPSASGLAASQNSASAVPSDQPENTWTQSQWRWTC